VHAVPEVATWAFIFFAFVMRPVVRGKLPVHQALQSLGEVFTHQGEDEEALSILTIALEGFTWMGVHQGGAECMQTIGDIHFRHGELSKAFSFFTEARPLFELSLQAKALVEVDARLTELERRQEADLRTLSELSVTTAPLQLTPESPLSNDDKANEAGSALASGAQKH
jgi:hypothetical protein